MGWLSRAWAWLVLHWNWEPCSLCGRFNIRKGSDDAYSMYPCCRECDAEIRSLEG